MNRALSHCRPVLASGLALTAALVLSACQHRPPLAPGAAAAPAASTAGAGLPRLGGMRPGETYQVVDCPDLSGSTCTIRLQVVAPPGGSGGQCQVQLATAVSLPRTLNQLQWRIEPVRDTQFEYRFRHAQPNAQGPYGVRIIDDLTYAPAPGASSPMVPIWAPRTQAPAPDLVVFDRSVRDWPPRISAYDIYVEYRLVGARDWTPCDTWDPIIISRD